MGLPEQLHMGFAWCESTLACVAPKATGNDIVPRRIAATTPRHDVVHTELIARKDATAILALIIVACQKISSIEASRLLGHFIVS